MHVALRRLNAHSAQQGCYVVHRRLRGRAALHAAAARANFFLLNYAGCVNLPAAGQCDGLYVQHSALKALYGQTVNHAHARAALGRAVHRVRVVVAGVHHPFYVGAAYRLAPVHLCQPCRHLYYVDRVAPGRGIAAHQLCLCLSHIEAHALCRAVRNLSQLVWLQRAEVNLHAARTQCGRQFLGRARCRAHQPEIRGQAVFKYVAYMLGHGGIIRVVIRAFKPDHAVFQYLQQLVHLSRMQFADLVQKQHAAVRARDRAFLGLRYAVYAQHSRALIYRVVHRTYQAVGDGALVKPHAGRIHLDKRRVGFEWRAGRVLGGLQYQPRRAGLAYAGRAVYDYVLRVGGAEYRLQRAYAVLLADYV